MEQDIDSRLHTQFERHVLKLFDIDRITVFQQSGFCWVNLLRVGAFAQPTDLLEFKDNLFRNAAHDLLSRRAQPGCGNR